MSAATMPVGFLFMETAPKHMVPGAYNPKTSMWENDGCPSHKILAAGTATGSNASTGAAYETDANEDYD